MGSNNACIYALANRYYAPTRKPGVTKISAEGRNLPRGGGQSLPDRTCAAVMENWLAVDNGEASISCRIATAGAPDNQKGGLDALSTPWAVAGR